MQLGIKLSYDALELHEDRFESEISERVTPFGHEYWCAKERAFALADERSSQAAIAGAANTLSFSKAGIRADNTDGIGLVRDLMSNLELNLKGKRILILGAGGAVQGALPALLNEHPDAISVLNRTEHKNKTMIEAVQAAYQASEGQPVVTIR